MAGSLLKSFDIEKKRIFTDCCICHFQSLWSLFSRGACSLDFLEIVADLSSKSLPQGNLIHRLFLYHIHPVRIENLLQYHTVSLKTFLTEAIMLCSALSVAHSQPASLSAPSRNLSHTSCRVSSHFHTHYLSCNLSLCFYFLQFCSHFLCFPLQLSLTPASYRRKSLVKSSLSSSDQLSETSRSYSSKYQTCWK